MWRLDNSGFSAMSSHRGWVWCSRGWVGYCGRLQQQQCLCVLQEHCQGHTQSRDIKWGHELVQDVFHHFCTFPKCQSSQMVTVQCGAHLCLGTESCWQAWRRWTGAGSRRGLAELDLCRGLRWDLCCCRCWWMCPARQTDTLPWRRTTTSSTGGEPKSVRCCPCCSCSCWCE